ncbi:unnamed protein product [Ixodes hexagonus]
MHTRSKNSAKTAEEKAPAAKPEIQEAALTLRRLSARLNAKLGVASSDSEASTSTPKPDKLPAKRKSDGSSDQEGAETDHGYFDQPAHGDYLISLSDLGKENHPIWRIERKSMLQRFEAFKDIESCKTMYRGTSSYTSWVEQDASKYARLKVFHHAYSRQDIVVEVLSIKKDEVDKILKELSPSDIRKRITTLRSKFEVYLQVLLSNALDSNFLIEVHEEDDEYFLESMEQIDSENGEHLRELLECHTLDGALVTTCETFPDIGKVKLEEGHTGRNCDGCSECGATTNIFFGPEQYDELRLTLLAQEDHVEHDGKTEFSLCNTCARLLELYSRLYHYRYFTFQACKKQVERMAERPRSRSAPITLVQNLGANKWLVLESVPDDRIWVTLENCLRDISWVDEVGRNTRNSVHTFQRLDHFIHGL